MEATPAIISHLASPNDAPWIVVDGACDTLEVHASNGEYICGVHGDTLAIQCDRAALIAALPDLLKRCRDLEIFLAEFLEIADEVAERRRGFMRFLELADRIDPRPDEEK